MDGRMDEYFDPSIHPSIHPFIHPSTQWLMVVWTLDFEYLGKFSHWSVDLSQFQFEIQAVFTSVNVEKHCLHFQSQKDHRWLPRRTDSDQEEECRWGNVLHQYEKIKGEQEKRAEETEG